MTVEYTKVIDFICHEPETDTVLLVMVEHRERGVKGELLPELQAKLNVYLAYVLDGQMKEEYSSYTGKKMRINLRTQYSPTLRELEFLDRVKRIDLAPLNIDFVWSIFDPNGKEIVQ